MKYIIVSHPHLPSFTAVAGHADDLEAAVEAVHRLATSYPDKPYGICEVGDVYVGTETKTVDVALVKRSGQ